MKLVFFPSVMAWWLISLEHRADTTKIRKAEVLVSIRTRAKSLGTNGRKNKGFFFYFPDLPSWKLIYVAQVIFDMDLTVNWSVAYHYTIDEETNIVSKLVFDICLLA